MSHHDAMQIYHAVKDIRLLLIGCWIFLMAINLGVWWGQ